MKEMRIWFITPVTAFQHPRSSTRRWLWLRGSFRLSIAVWLSIRLWRSDGRGMFKIQTTGKSNICFQQFGSPGRTVYSNNPMALETGSGLMGAEVDLRLISYTNSGLKLPNGTTCNCPISNCNFVPSNHQNQCQFSFVLVISCAE